MCSKRNKYNIKYPNNIQQSISKETQMYYACTALYLYGNGLAFIVIRKEDECIYMKVNLNKL